MRARQEKFRQRALVLADYLYLPIAYSEIEQGDAAQARAALLHLIESDAALHDTLHAIGPGGALPEAQKVALRLLFETLPVRFPFYQAYVIGALAAAAARGQPHLHLVTRPTAWTAWAAEAGLPDTQLLKGQRFEIQSMLIAAACAGLGLALLPRFLIESPLRRGELKVVSDTALVSDGAYYFAYPEEKADEPHLLAFRQWLQGIAGSFREEAWLPLDAAAVG